MVGNFYSSGRLAEATEFAKVRETLPFYSW
jgi:hypothetical protein